MGCIKLLLSLFLLPLFGKKIFFSLNFDPKNPRLKWINNIFIFLVDSDTCNDQVHLNGRQQKSSIYCSTCSAYVDGQASAPIVKIELPSLSQLTGIYVQKSNKNQEENSVETKKKVLLLIYFDLYLENRFIFPWISTNTRWSLASLWATSTTKSNFTKKNTPIKIFFFQLFIERRRLFFNDHDNSNETRTFLPSIIARQIRIIFITSSISTCAIIQIFGCQSQSNY